MKKLLGLLSVGIIATGLAGCGAKQYSKTELHKSYNQIVSTYVTTYYDKKNDITYTDNKIIKRTPAAVTKINKIDTQLADNRKNTGLTKKLRSLIATEKKELQYFKSGVKKHNESDLKKSNKYSRLMGAKTQEIANDYFDGKVPTIATRWVTVDDRNKVTVTLDKMEYHVKNKNQFIAITGKTRSYSTVQVYDDQNMRTSSQTNAGKDGKFSITSNFDSSGNYYIKATHKGYGGKSKLFKVIDDNAAAESSADAASSAAESSSQAAAASSASAEYAASESSSQAKAKSESESEAAEANASAEDQSALAKAEDYATTMDMSKQGVYEQLTSDAGEQFSPEAGQYAIDHLTDIDWNANALAKAKDYQSEMDMSPAEIRDQLTSSSGEQFTQSEADYAVQHLND